MAILSNRLVTAEFSRNVWFIRGDENEVAEDLLEPSYFAHVARQLKTGDQIEFLSNDVSVFATFIVTYATDTGAKLVMLSSTPLVKTATQAPAQEQSNTDVRTHTEEFPDYVIRYVNDKVKFRVVRRSDRAVVQSGFDTDELARNWLRAHLKAEAA